MTNLTTKQTDKTKKTITLDEFAKQFTDPERFKSDLLELHSKMTVFSMLYGGIGWKALEDAISQEGNL